MLAILTTHPIQYQVPLWQALARDGRVPFEVWYLTDHGVNVSHDREFGGDFAWDLDMLEGYPYRFISTVQGATPDSFWKCRLNESFSDRLRNAGTTVLWVQGWQVAAYWQAVWTAKRVGVQVWLRGESNDLAPMPAWKRRAKSVIVGEFFRHVDQFLYIGSANRRLYKKFGVPDCRLHPGLYSVDNERFALQAKSLSRRRSELRKQWGIPETSACVLFCGKFIQKKRPLDVIAAARRLMESGQMSNLHLLFVGSGELGNAIRQECHIVHDAESIASGSGPAHHRNRNHPAASFTGFLNQTEICQAYVAADCLVLPSDYGETWGLVANEAMAAGLPCVLSDRCGSALDLARVPRNRVFPCGDVPSLASQIAAVLRFPEPASELSLPEGFSFAATVSTVAALSANSIS